AFNNITASSDGSVFTATTPNTTSFSVAIFSSEIAANSSSPFFYEYHHTAKDLKISTAGVKEVDATTVYGAARVTTVFTVYAFLAAIGDHHWLDPITLYIPELARLVTNSSIKSVNWQDVRLIDLASNMAGIVSDDTLGNPPIPSNLASSLPTLDHSVSGASIHSRQGLIDWLVKQQPIFLPSRTPIYSDAAFQVLAFAVESFTGESFDRVLDKYIFNTLDMSSSTLREPNGQINRIHGESTAILAAEHMYSNIADLSKAGRAILNSTLLSQVSTNRWLKPISQTSNSADDVGAPFVINRATLDGTNASALTLGYTQFGTQGLYSSYFGLAPDWGIGFTILSKDTEAAADLNAHVDLVSVYLLPALEREAMEQAGRNYGGIYTTGNMVLHIEVDGLSGLSLSQWTDDSNDLRAAYAESNEISPSSMDLRLYPTDLREKIPNGIRRAFRAVAQNIDAPIDAGTPTCTTWSTSVNRFVWNGVALDEFVFNITPDGVAMKLEVPAFDVVLEKI
ncbi:MAG: hypothetical protein Q9165_008903, partial [Trypethelium subeluteriae]